MKDHTHDHKEFIDILSAIEKDPASWAGWLALHFEMPAMCVTEDCSLISEGAARIVSLYLDDLHGEAFFSNDGDIVVLCKDVNSSALREIGQHLSDLCLARTHIPAEQHVYNVFLEGEGMCRNLRARLYQMEASGNGMTHGRHYGFAFERYMLEGRAVADKRHQMRVLVVDDDAITQRFVAKLLGNECQLATAMNAKDAVTAFDAEEPDITFLDIGLPDGNGKDLLAKFLAKRPGAYIVMFSGNDQMQTISETLKMGAEGFVAKPCSKDQMLYYLNRAPLQVRV